MTSDCSDRFDPGRYEAGRDIVAIRGYRGSRGAPIRREHVVNEDLFARVILLGRAYALHQVGGVDLHETRELSASQARDLAAAVRFLGAVLKDPLLGPHLDAIAQVADFCWRTDRDSRLVIEGP